jgi:hypothetical protein
MGGVFSMTVRISFSDMFNLDSEIISATKLSTASAVPFDLLGVILYHSEDSMRRKYSSSYSTKVVFQSDSVISSPNLSQR